MISKRRTGAREARARRGQGILEFAICAVVLTVLFSAIFEFSWIFYNYSYLNNTLNKAARLAVIGATSSAIQTEVAGAKGGLAINMPTITVQRPDGSAMDSSNREAGNWITISATIDYPNITPLSRLIQLSPFGTLASQCTVRIE